MKVASLQSLTDLQLVTAGKLFKEKIKYGHVIDDFHFNLPSYGK